MKSKIAFMLNLVMAITATAISEQQRLLHRWNLQGGYCAATLFFVKSVCYRTNAQ